MRSIRSTGTALCLAAALLHGTATAVTVVPNAQVLGTVLLNKPVQQRVDTVALGTFGVGAQGVGSAALSVLGQPLSTIVADAQTGPNGQLALLFASSGATLTFFFAIDGTTPTVDVFIDVFGAITGSATAGASFAMEASWSLYSNPQQTQLLASDVLQAPQQSGSFAQSFGRTVALTLNTGQIFRVDMRAQAGAAASDVLSQAEARAVVDPLFRFGAGVDAQQYSFAFSPGIGNQVPEPGAAWLFALGLGVLAVRRPGRLRGRSGYARPHAAGRAIAPPSGAGDPRC